MERTLPLALFAALLLLCQSAPASAESPASASPAPAAAAVKTPADPSYAFGLILGKNLKGTGVSLDYGAFLNGIRDAMEGKAPAMTMEEANAAAQQAISAAKAAAGQANKAKEAAFLAQNAKKPGIVTTASGLQYQVLKEGSGPKPLATDTVKVDYEGTLTDGTVFDSSIARGQPLVIPLDQVIPGWTEALQLMKVGGKYVFYIPSSLAYGETGAGDVIPPNATIVFQVTLIDIEPPAATPSQPQ